MGTIFKRSDKMKKLSIILILVFSCSVGCNSNDSIKKMEEVSFKAGACYAIKVQDEERERIAKCETYGDVADLAWEKFMLAKGELLLKQLGHGK